MKKETYYYKDKAYQILDEAEIKVGSVWIPVIIYQPDWSNRDGKTYVRFKEDFFRLFKTEQPDQKSMLLHFRV